MIRLRMQYIALTKYIVCGAGQLNLLCITKTTKNKYQLVEDIGLMKLFF